jgi:Protein tyrosine and serine/threonine kinase
MAVGEGSRVGTYLFVRALGKSSAGPWLARDGDGDRVVLRAVEGVVDVPEGEHLLPLLATVKDADEVTWAIVPWCGGGGLDALLARRRSLTPGEWVTIVAAVAGALAVLHATGRAHGDVRASHILLDLDGTVRLAALPAPTSSSPAEDVAALGQLAEGAMGANAPALLHRLLASCRCPDPEGRPEAAELARLVVRACPAVTIRVNHTERSADKPSRWSLRRAAAAVGLAAAVLVAVEAGHLWGGNTAQAGTLLPSAVQASSPRSADPAPAEARKAASAAEPTRTARAEPAPPRAIVWSDVVTGLDTSRAMAFASGRAVDLTAIDAPGSPAMRRDVATVDELDGRGVVARGWRARLEEVTVERRTQQRVTLSVHDRLAAYTLVTTAGVVRHRVAARGPRWWRLELRRVLGEWRVWDVKPIAVRTL